MALVVSPGGVTPPKSDTRPEITTEGYETNLIDTKEWIGVDITTQLDGSPWTVNFYHQVIGDSQTPSAPQPAQPDVYQQYQEILDFEIMVTQPLSNQQNTETGEFEVTGEANIYPGITPMQYDAFIATAPDGRLAMFVIQEVRRLTIYKRSAFTITYIQKEFVSPVVSEFFQERTVERLHFRKDYLRNGRYPFLTSDQYASHNNLRKIRGDLVDIMNRYYYNPLVSGFPVPGQAGLTYDPFMARAWRDIVAYTRDYQYRKLSIQNTMGSTIDRALALWDVLLGRASWNPNVITQKMALVSAGNVTWMPGLYSIRYTQYEALVVPTGHNTFPGAANMFNPANGWEMGKDPTLTCDCQGCNEPKPPPFDPPYPSDNPPIMNPVTADPYYIFSKAFYLGDTTRMSVTEREVYKVINGEALNLENLLRINDNVFNLGTLERYYCTAILYCLLVLYEWR